MENRNFTSKIIPKLETEANVIITKQEDILKEVCTFYQKLYNEDKDIENIDLNEYMRNSNVQKLNDQESEKLEGWMHYSCRSRTNFKEDEK